MFKYLFVIFSMVLLSGCSLFGDYETPKYTVVEEIEKNVTIREYDPYIVAEVALPGKINDSSGQGFRILAGYIFGDNKSNTEMAMTAPVIQEQSSEEIAMTAPVLQEQQSDRIIMQFIMPSDYTLKTLPKPNDDRIKIYKFKPDLLAAIEFSGRWTDQNRADHLQKLQDHLQGSDWMITGSHKFAAYNDPFTPFFLRHNEVLIPVKRKAD